MLLHSKGFLGTSENDGGASGDYFRSEDIRSTVMRSHHANATFMYS